jgi:hypothetical protein
VYYLNTTRQLRVPLPADGVDRLVSALTNQIVPSVSAVEGLQSMSWMLSSDRLTLQAFSGWLTEDGPSQAEQHGLHVSNSVLINELLGGLAGPQQHTFYQLLAQRSSVLPAVMSRGRVRSGAPSAFPQLSRLHFSLNQKQLLIYRTSSVLPREVG